MTTGHIFDPCNGCHLAWIKGDTDVFSGMTGKQFARLRGRALYSFQDEPLNLCLQESPGIISDSAALSRFRKLAS
jgi:hypothetical protein